MAELMLVNPRRRRRRKTTATKRNPRRRRKMTALQAKFFGPKRRRRVTRRNPRRRRASVAAAPVRHRRRRLRRNPTAASRRRSGGLSLRSITSGGILKSTVLPAAIGAFGAVALDAAYAYLPIPISLKSGQFSAPVKAAAIIGLGALGSRFLPRQSGMIRNAVSASLTIMAYNFIKAHVQAMLPNVQLGAYIDGGMGYVQAGQFIPDNSGMGAYIDGVGGNAGVAWSNVGDTIGDEVF